MYKLQKALGALTLLIATGSAQAALVSYVLTGDILSGDENFPNTFGLAVGDTITASGVFDDSVLSSGSGTIDFSLGSGNTMTLSVGSATFTANDDSRFGSGTGPALSLSSFALTNLDFNNPGVFGSLGLFFDDADMMIGEWRTSAELTTVPVPAAVWLFGSGLLGLVGIARRKRAA